MFKELAWCGVALCCRQSQEMKGGCCSATGWPTAPRLSGCWLAGWLLPAPCCNVCLPLLVHNKINSSHANVYQTPSWQTMGSERKNKTDMNHRLIHPSCRRARMGAAPRTVRHFPEHDQNSHTVCLCLTLPHGCPFVAPNTDILSSCDCHVESHSQADVSSV